MVERSCRDLTKKHFRRDVFNGVKAPQERILVHIEEHDRQPKPLIWIVKANLNNSPSVWRTTLASFLPSLNLLW
jgi:hypothetical protein